MTDFTGLYEQVARGNVDFLNNEAVGAVLPETLYFIAALNNKPKIVELIQENFGNVYNHQTIDLYSKSAEIIRKHPKVLSAEQYDLLNSAAMTAIRQNDGQSLDLILRSNLIEPDYNMLKEALKISDPNYVLDSLLDSDDFISKTEDGMEKNAQIVGTLIRNGEYVKVGKILDSDGMNFWPDSAYIIDDEMEAINRANDKDSGDKYLKVLEILLENGILKADQKMGGIDNFPMASVISRKYKKLAHLLLQHGGSNRTINQSEFLSVIS